MKTKFALLSVVVVLCAMANTALAQAEPKEAGLIRKNMTQNLKNFPSIDAVRKTPIDGIFEVQYAGSEIIYANKDGTFLIQGSLIDGKQSKNVTQERIAKLTAINFSELPLKDAFTVVKGNGKRKVAVFADPNCGFCKRFESDLEKVDNLTTYVFLYPVLGADSQKKARDIWCSADKQKAWKDWMLNGTVPQTAAESCDTSAVDRVIAFGQSKKITGTPTSFFASGSRTPGAIPSTDVERLLENAN